MNVLVVDTSSWIAYLKGAHSPDLELGLKEGRVYLPPIVIAELLSARLKPSERKDLQAFLKELPLCETPFEHWDRVGSLRSRIATKGFHLSTPDAHIAQCTLDLEGYLLSEDSVFRKIAHFCSLRMLS